jgi:hypothetical protein
MSDKELIFKIYKEPELLNNNKITLLKGKWAKALGSIPTTT